MNIDIYNMKMFMCIYLFTCSYMYVYVCMRMNMYIC